jgi:hypothetical protein
LTMCMKTVAAARWETITPPSKPMKLVIRLTFGAVLVVPLLPIAGLPQTALAL